MIDEIPELGPLGSVAPQLVRANEQRIFQHVNGGPELAPDDGSRSSIHLDLSNCGAAFKLRADSSALFGRVAQQRGAG